MQKKINILFIFTLLGSLFISQPLFASSLEQQYQNGMRQIFDDLISIGADEILVRENGRPLRLSELKAQITNIHFISKQSVFSKIANNSQCYDMLDYQWLTADDNPNENRPVIAFPRANTLVGANTQTWQLLLHETISALGVVDDEYQVSSVLLLLSNDARGTSLAEIMKDPGRAALLARLKSIKTRKHAPRYKLDGSNSCYDSSSMIRVSRLDSGNNATGIGGGGNEDSLTFKSKILEYAPLWWGKNNKSNYGEKERTLFLSLLLDLGIEPLDTSADHLIQVLPPPLEFKRSKRTGKLTVFLKLENLYTSSTQDTLDIERANADVILNHIYRYMLPAKTLAQRDRHAIYGNELAYKRKLGAEFGGFQGPFFPK